MTSPEALDCQVCGACCFSNSERAIRVSGGDHARLDELAEELSVFVGNQCFMRLAGERCAALERGPEGRLRCAIYEQRPEVCRRLERGSDECRAERHAKLERMANLIEPGTS